MKCSVQSVRCILISSVRMGSHLLALNSIVLCFRRIFLGASEDMGRETGAVVTMWKRMGTP